MNNAKTLAQKYYNVVLKYEEFLKNYEKPEINLESYPENMKKVLKEIIEVINHCYEKDCMPWRLIEGDKLDGITKIFETKNNGIISYLRAEDEISDMLYEMAKNDVYGFCFGKSVNIKKLEVLCEVLEIDIVDNIRTMIDDEISQLHLKEELDDKIFSSDTIKVHGISREFNEVCNELFNYYRDYQEEKVDNSQETEEIEY